MVAPVLCVLLLSLIQRAAGLELTVGFLPSFARDTDAPVGTYLFRKAMEKLKDEGRLPKELKINLVYSPACDHGTAAAFAASLYHNASARGSLAAVVGAPCTRGTALLGQLMGFWNLPIVANLAKGSELADKETFPTTARVAEHGSSLGPSLLEFLQHNGWLEFGWMTDPKRAALLHDSMDRALDAQTLITSKAKINIRLNPDSTCDEAEVRAALTTLRDRARIIVLAFDSWHTVGQPEIAARQIILIAQEMGMAGPDYVYVVPLGSANLMPPTGVDHLPTLLDSTETAFRQTIVQLPVSRSATQLAIAVDTFEAWSREPDADKLYPGIRQVVEARNWNVSLMMLNHDGAYLYGKALGACLNETNFPPKDRKPCDWRDGRRLMELIKFMQFDGLSGPILMDENFERKVAYYLYGLSPQTGLKTRYWRQEVEMDTNLFGDRIARRRIHLDGSFPWATEDGRAPPAVPPCGFRGEGCPGWLTQHWEVLLGLAIAVLVVLILVVYQIRKRRAERALLAKSWEIPTSAIRPLQRRNSASAHSLHSLQSVGASSSGKDDAPPAPLAVTDTVGYVGPAMVANRRLALKHYPTTELLHISKRETLAQLKQLKELQHENLAGFIGLSLSAKSGVQVLWELCPKGSLAEVLFSRTEQLDAVFRGAIVRDIVNGLDFLHHSPLACHEREAQSPGQLTSENCLVDSRWTVKLSDFQLPFILRPNVVLGRLRFKQYSAEKLLHTAPEILRTWVRDIGCAEATPEGDVFSFGMILHQLISGEPLSFSLGSDADTVVDDVAAGRRSLFRLPIPRLPAQVDEGGEVKEILIPLMQACWAEDADIRPKASRVKKTVSGLASGRVSLVEHMMAAMEQYTADLEKTVAARTEEVREEKARAEELLGRMLPAVVAEQLKKGLAVPPETFSEVTIYFSDIVGFTTISGRSEPLQVVTFLNYLYITFDSIIAKFDAYKVETIGDAYMVASGLPKRNGSRHAEQIALLALAIRAAVEEMRIPHEPLERIHVRIGLHSGPCAAGVVGDTMPRYCLFGDTVNTASRMESTGEAGKIQISEGTLDVLQAFPGFDTEFRGTTPVKGKGEMRTFWLNGGPPEQQ